MKRKLDQTEEPNKRSRYGDQPPYWDSAASFDRLGLEPRLLQAIQKQKFSSPTPIQARAIPLALDGKDILGTYTNVKRLEFKLTSLSAIKDGLRQDCRICSSNSTLDTPTKDGQFRLEIYVCPYSCAYE
jgi:ATP-dependent RNA helicase DDX56/DBP9